MSRVYNSWLYDAERTLSLERENRALADALTSIAAIPTTPAQMPEAEQMRVIAVQILCKLGRRL